MSGAPTGNGDRDSDDAEAREWARAARERAEAGLARDDSEFLERKLVEERRRLAAAASNDPPTE